MSSAARPVVSERKRRTAPAEAPPTHDLPPLAVAGASAGVPVFLQTKLAVSEPDDEYEREADGVANAAAANVTRGSYPASFHRSASTVHRSPHLPDAEGAPLPDHVRAKVEPLLGADLRDVRVHTGASASRSVDAVEARAFTHGRHIWLSERESLHDLRLMAHEATHVIQQTGGGNASPVRAAAPARVDASPHPGLPLFLQRAPAPHSQTVDPTRSADFNLPAYSPVTTLPVPVAAAGASAARADRAPERRPESPGDHAGDAGRHGADGAIKSLGGSDADKHSHAAGAKPDDQHDEKKDKKKGEKDKSDRKAGKGDVAQGSLAADASRSKGATVAQRGQADADEPSLPPALDAVADQSIAAPRLDLPTLEGEWPIAPSISAESLPKSDGAATGNKPAPSKAAGEPRKKTTERDVESATGVPDPVEDARRTREASSLAQDAYRELSQRVRGEQEAFVGRAGVILRDMAHGYDTSAGEIVRGLEADQRAVDDATQRAISEVELAATAANAQLDDASAATAAAIDAAGRSAYGLIAAGVNKSAKEIDAVVASLVAGHLGAYNAAIASTRSIADSALAALDEWKKARATNFPTDGGDYLEDAKNESRQARIPRFVDPESKRLDKRVKETTKAWESSRDTTVCGLDCSFHAQLKAQNEAMAKQGRNAVASALTHARKALADQTRDGKKALAGLRRSFLRQITVQQRSAKSRLSSRARATLFALRGEAQSALAGVQSAARGSLPSYWHGVQGFEQSIGSAAVKGPQAVTQTAKRAPQGILDGVERAQRMLDERLAGNRARLDRSLSEKEVGQRQSSAVELAQLDATFQEQNSQAVLRLDEAAGGFLRAFGQLAGTVSRAAQSWTQPLEKRMAAFIKAKHDEASAELTKLLTGKPPASASGQTAAPAPDGDGKGAGGGEASCGHCATAASQSSASAGGAGPAPAPAADGGGGQSEPKGLTKQVDDEIEFFTKRLDPNTYFEPQLTATGAQVEDNLTKERSQKVVHAFEGGFAGSVDEEGVIGALRGLTPIKGRALDLVVYPRAVGRGTLDYSLRWYLDADSKDYAAASAYLRGDAVEGARLELKDSLGFFNDDEARIEAVMRALSPGQLAALGAVHPDVMQDVRDALDGTDVQVFDALAKGDYAAADAYRMRDEVDEARRKGDADDVNKAIEKWTVAPSEGDWRATEGVEVSADDRRKAVVEALGHIVSDEDVAYAAGKDGVKGMTAEQRAIAYVTRDVQVYVGEGSQDGSGMETRRITGANKDLAVALLTQPADSVDVRAARIGVELQRGGDPDILNLDKATFDEGFSKDPNKIQTEEEREAHREAAEKRARVLMLAAEKYAAGKHYDRDVALDPNKKDAKDPTAPMNDARVTEARDTLIAALSKKLGDDKLKTEVAAGLLTDARPSPKTVAKAMALAQRGVGTDEEMLFHFSERMDRDEIAAMRAEYQQQTGNSLDADLGTFGEGGFFTELSGDDRLRMERALMGVARNDKERMENAMFALQQQRKEAGSFGAWLAEGTLADVVMSNTERRLELMAGGKVEFGKLGAVQTKLSEQIFDPKTGEYKGKDHDTFLATVNVAKQVAEDYAHRIDAFADVLTTGIAILGAIAAVVITVVTGGAAAPLIAAAVVTGLASMAANRAIKGGRYGWEQAGIDLAMTAVQAVTAGIGAQLGAAAQIASKGAAAAAEAAETLSALAKIFTGNPVVDQIIVGAITNSISGLGMAALNEQTWEGKDPVGALFDGLVRGAVTGAATAAFTQSIEALGRNGAAISARAEEIAAQSGLGNKVLGTLGRGAGAVGKVVGAGMTASAESGAGSMVLRGLTRATISGVSSMAGKGAEILYNTAIGTFHGDVGDAFKEMGQAGLQAAIQGIGEGVGESVGQAFHNQRVARAAESINRVRDEMGLPRLSGEHLEHAAEDLLFLATHGRRSGDGAGRVLDLEHVATHGGMTPTRATVDPEPSVTSRMREELMRHVEPEMRSRFGDVPIRVLPESEYRALTRSESGPVVTLIENGHPVVVIREGTPLARLADEGPHLVQAREQTTRQRVAKLDEATLANWDKLDIDTQLDLYGTKIGLEIDAHEHIARSLEEELSAARGSHEKTARIEADIERNEGTLRNLRARADEVAAIGPEERAAIAAGHEHKPQYLEQPARLFSKDESLGRRGVADEESLDFPEEPPPHPEGGRLFDRTPRQDDEAFERMQRGSGFNTEEEHKYGYNEVFIEHANGKPGEYQRVDSYIPHEEIHERFYSQLAEAPADQVIAKMNKVLDDYAGARIADVPSNRNRGLTPGDRLFGDPVLIIPEQHAPVPHEILEHAERNGILLRDASGREYNLRHPDGDEHVLRASTRQDDEDAGAMRDALLRHVPPEQREALADTLVVVLRPEEYRQLTRSERGPVVTIIRDGTPIVVVREGTAVSRLADEGPHLVQANEPRTRAAVARLDEETLANWDKLDLDTQLSLYRTKLALEIDAHTRIARSLRGEIASGEGDPARIRREMERNEGTLRSLRARREEVDAIGPRQRARIMAGTEERPQYLDQPARLFSKEGTGEPKYPDQPELRGPRLTGEPESTDALRQQHEDWAERMRREFLAPGTMPPMVEGDAPRPARPPWHASIEAAYAEYNSLLAQTGGRREVGIYRNADTGEYMVVVGSAVNVQAGREALRQETVLHYHPDYGPTLYRGPSGSDLAHTAMLARELGRPVTEFIEFSVPGQGRGRTAFTVSPVSDASVPGGIRMQIDLEFVNPTTGEYTHQRFTSRKAWSDYYNSRTAAFDPDGAVYWHIMRSMGMSDEQIAALAAAHREAGVPAPPPPEFLPRGAARGSLVVGEDEAAQARAVVADAASTLARASRSPDPDETPNLRQSAAELRRLQRHERQLDGQIEALVARRQNLEEELRGWRSRGGPAASERERDITSRVATMHEQEETMRRRRDEIVASIRAELRSVLPEVARRLTADVGALIEAIREFETKQGRRPDAKELIEALRNRVRKSPFADLEGLISTASLEQNVIAIMDMRDQIRGIAPDAVISVQRGGAFLAEVLARGVTDFPPSIVVEKKVTPRPGKEDLVQRTPNIRAEIERRMAAGQRKFVIVDFYMGGHFAEELEAMVQELHAKFPDSGLEIHPLWMRETYGYDTIGTPAPVEGRRTPRPTRAQLTEGIVFIGGVTKRIVDDPITGERQTFLRFRRESETVTLPAIRGNAENLSIIRQAQFPVGVVLGDDMDIVFDPASREPIRIFDRTGRVVQEIPVGTRDPITGEKLETTRDILIRLMQGVQFPGARESATIP